MARLDYLCSNILTLKIIKKLSHLYAFGAIENFDQTEIIWYCCVLYVGIWNRNG